MNQHLLYRTAAMKAFDKRFTPYRQRLALGIIAALFASMWMRGLVENKEEAAALDRLKAFGAIQKYDHNGCVVDLKLERGRFSDVFLAEIGAFPKLRGLSLHGSDVTDSGLAKCQILKHLETLRITDTQVTDRGLSHLTHIRTLRQVWICESVMLTPEGIARLQSAVPHLDINVMNRAKQ